MVRSACGHARAGPRDCHHFKLSACVQGVGSQSARRSQYDHGAHVHHHTHPWRCPQAAACQGDAMLLASSSNSYPLLGVFWTILEIFLFVIWFWILITVFIDIFRSQDLSGGGKAVWFLFVLFIPLIGVLVYLIVRGSSMHERAAQQAQQQDAAFRSYVQEAAGEPSTADQLAKLADLRDRGVITAQEFESQKAKIL